MYSKLNALLDRAAYLGDDGVRYMFYFSLMRCALQVSAIAALEHSLEALSPDETADLSSRAKKLLHSSDGDFISILDGCLPAIRQAGWPSCLRSWFDVPPAKKEEAGCRPVRQLAEAFVRERNSRSAHGVLDRATVLRGLEIFPDRLRRLFDGLADLLPTALGEDTPGPATVLRLATPGGDLDLRSYFLVDGSPIVIRRFERRGSTWRVKYQVLDPERSEEGVEDVAASTPVVALITASGTILGSTTAFVGDRRWTPSLVLPSRQTDTFEGRHTELQGLLEWWNETDSRACLVYGEGGIGKTTLVLEFLHSLLESPSADLLWTPALLFYFSAKRTRWGVQGLEYIKGVVPSISDAVRSLAQILDDSVERDWLAEDPRALIDRSSQLLSQLALDRKDVLFVLDNTEALARSAAEERELSKSIQQLSSKVGRLLMTSRRRESVEARPVQVPPMDEVVGPALLRRLAKAYDAQALSQAGDATLRKVCRQLSGKPLLIDVLARYLAKSGGSIDRGVRRILSQERGELGEFLFEDAWLRMDQRHRQVFLTLGQLGGTIAGQVVAWTCAEAEVHVSDWNEAFLETRFGSLYDYGSQYDVVIEPGAREYLSKKFSELTRGDREAIERIALRVRRRYHDILKAESSRVTDRVAQAFRTSAAKAAKLAAQRGEKDEAILWYEEAVGADPANAALFDRFAWFLMKSGDLKRAWHVSLQACSLDENDADCCFTAGMVAARRGDSRAADGQLLNAERLGKKSHLCALQRARARIERAEILRRLPRRLELLDEADSLLSDATLAQSKGWWDDKHMKELEWLRRRVKSLRARLFRMGR